VLVNFQVQQNGNAIRVVDADGSVYDGSLLPESAIAQIEPAPAATPASPVTAPEQVERAKTIASRDESQTAQNYFFRVTGTNQTLKQNVVFAGNLLATANATTNLQQSFGGNGGLGGGAGGWPVATGAHDSESIAMVEFAHRGNGGDCRHQPHRNQRRAAVALIFYFTGAGELHRFAGNTTAHAAVRRWGAGALVFDAAVIIVREFQAGFSSKSIGTLFHSDHHSWAAPICLNVSDAVTAPGSPAARVRANILPFKPSSAPTARNSTMP
jgi:hypothetical protein